MLGSEEIANDLRGSQHLFEARHFDGYFVQLDARHFAAPALPAHEDISKLFSGRVEGHVDAVGRPARAVGVVGGGDGCAIVCYAGGFGFHDANHAIIVAARAQGVPDGRVDGEQGFFDAGIQDGHITAVNHLLIRKEASPGHAVVVHLRIPGDGAIEVAIDAPSPIPGVLAHDPGRHEDFDAREGGADTIQVRIGNSVFEEPGALGCAAFFLGRFDAAHNDVVASQASDLLLSFIAGPFADGEHGDHRTHPEDNAEHGKQ